MHLQLMAVSKASKIFSPACYLWPNYSQYSRFGTSALPCTAAKTSSPCLGPAAGRRYMSPMSTATSAPEKLATSKAEGDISSVFSSLTGAELPPLPKRFADLKTRLIAGNEEAVKAAWAGLLPRLKKEIDCISSMGPRVVPTIEFKDIKKPGDDFNKAMKRHGVAVVKGVVPPEQALQWKQDIKDYIKANPHTKAFPPDDPQVYELYWSPSQVAARSHSSLLAAQSFLMSFWHFSDPSALVSTQHPLSYADRLRIRQPGDNRFALGPHCDGGSVERWEEEGYGLGHIYDAVFRGELEKYDPWESSGRLKVCMDLYKGPSACSVFRMFQGWLSMSETRPGEGTLLVNPLFDRAVAYYLLRPFFEPKVGRDKLRKEQYLDASNWKMKEDMNSSLEGAYPSQCLELNDKTHPHLELERSMVHVPKVNPGDYVVWHCDTIHAVDSSHQGETDSSVLYIPATPLTVANAAYIATQCEHFFHGIPAPDFPGGVGESKHVGRPTLDEFKDIEKKGRQAMGVQKFTVADGLEPRFVKEVNAALGY